MIKIKQASNRNRILSSSMTAALLKSTLPMPLDTDSDEYDMSLAGNSQRLLIQPKKLRNTTLFRECFIHVVDTWDSESEDEEIKQHSDIYGLVIKKHGRIYRMIADALLFYAGNTTVFDVRKIKHSEQDSPAMNDPGFYRALKAQIADYREKRRSEGSLPARYTALLNSLEELVANNLVLSKSTSSSLPYFFVGKSKTRTCHGRSNLYFCEACFLLPWRTLNYICHLYEVAY